MCRTLNEKWRKINNRKNKIAESRKKKKEKIRTLGEKENYKYLGILESDIIIQTEMKEKIRK